MKRFLISLSLSLLVVSCGAEDAPYVSDAETSE